MANFRIKLIKADIDEEILLSMKGTILGETEILPLRHLEPAELMIKRLGLCCQIECHSDTSIGRTLWVSGTEIPKFSYGSVENAYDYGLIEWKTAAAKMWKNYTMNEPEFKEEFLGTFNY